MKKNTKKFLAILLCAVISSTSFCGCDDNENVAMEDLPYGATMRQLNDTKIDICYDGRYFTDEEMKIVSDYYYSIQTLDTELFKKTQNSDYISYIEKNSGQKAEDFLKTLSDNNTAALGEGYKYSYIEAVNYGDKSDDIGIGEIIELMNSIYKENGKDEAFEDTLLDEKFASFDIIAMSGGQEYTQSNQIVYIFTCKDGVYIFD